MFNSSFKMPIFLILLVVLTFFFGDLIPVDIQRVFYTISLIIKELLVFLLPFLIFTLLFGSIVNLGKEKGTFKYILLLLVSICLSNFLATWVAFFSGSFALSKMQNLNQIQSSASELLPLINFSLPKLIKNEVALILGFVSGLVFSGFKAAKYFSNEINAKTTDLLKKYFIPVVPLFILGFVIKLQHDGVLEIIVKNYILIFIVIGLTQLAYILLLFIVATKFNFVSFVAKIKNVIPPFLTGFTTMSSAAALPMTLLAAEKNTHNKTLSRFVIPTTVNIHLIGDCLAIPILALAILKSFGMPLPELNSYFIFTIFFVIAKFAVAAVPGGGIIVMLPILQQYLGFSSEMLSLITALYILLDSLITGMNVAGNSAFVVIFYKLSNLLFQIKHKE